MYSISKYHFNEYKTTPGHRANYAILCNPEFQANQWGMKYSPVNNYSKEYKILSFFSHPQIPQRYKDGTDVMYKDGRLLISQNYLIMTHFEGEDIVEYYQQKELPDHHEIERIIQYFFSILQPLHHMHAKGYIHSDIKPGHLILNHRTGTMALIDLECTIKTGGIICGMSKEYASPEQKQMIRLLRDPASGENEKSILKKITLSAASDLYSLGLILYRIATKKLWQESNIQPAEINPAISDKFNKIILGLLEVDPHNRISSAEELKNELESI